jgi:hypothetical protein
VSKNTEKITVTGNYIEIKKYEKSVNRALPSKNGGRRRKGYKSDNSAKYRKQTINTQRVNVRRKVLGSFGVGPRGVLFNGYTTFCSRGYSVFNRHKFIY